MPKETKDKESYETAIEEALAAPNPEEATLKLAAMYLRDINNDVRCDIGGQPNSDAVKEYNLRRDAMALAAYTAALIASQPAMIQKIAAAIKAAKG